MLSWQRVCFPIVIPSYPIIVIIISQCIPIIHWWNINVSDHWYSYPHIIIHYYGDTNDMVIEYDNNDMGIEYSLFFISPYHWYTMGIFMKLLIVLFFAKKTKSQQQPLGATVISPIWASSWRSKIEAWRRAERRHPTIDGDSLSLDWFKGKFTGNHGFYHQI